MATGDIGLTLSEGRLTVTYRGRPVLSTRCGDFEISLADRALPPPRLADVVEEETGLVLDYAVGSGFRVAETVERATGHVERRLRIRREGSPGEPQRLLSARLLLTPELARPAFSVPMARIEPALPHDRAVRRPRELPAQGVIEGMYDIYVAAPATIAGTVAMESGDGEVSAATTPLPLACPVHTRIYGRDGQAVIEHEFGCESWLDEGAELEIAAQAIQVWPRPWRQGRHEVGRLLARCGYAPPADRPAWARDAVIYEAELGFEGGLSRLRQRLPELRRTGFNTLYLMPWHRGGYATLDYHEMAPRHGSLDDLCRLTAAAHALGLRVLFDLLVNIAADGSPYVAEHPDWFYRDTAGRPLPHPSWKANCFDPASPGFRRFLTDYAVRCCEEWGADGFRVDAVSYRGGLWRNRPGLQPHQHAHAVFSLVSEIRQAIRAAEPDRILMAECFGPGQVPISDLVCFQWIDWLDWALERVLDGRLDGSTVQALLADHFAVMPPGTWLTTYTHTHDTVAFAKRDLDGPPVRALFATLVLLSAGGMVFGGGWKMRRRPGPDEAEDYRALFAAKRRFGGVTTSDVEFPAVGDPALFVAERPSAAGPVRVTTSFSPQPRPFAPVGELLYCRLGSGERTIAPYDTVVERAQTSPGAA
ncbi:MAG: alpha-amylase family glycosyl hydrolase [Candidatus Brocadiia bacterium]